MKKALRAAVSFAASLTLAAGLVPAAAFAGSGPGAVDDGTASGYVAGYSMVDAVAAAACEADEADEALVPLSSDTVTASGTSGTVTWTLYDDGELNLAPASGDEGTLRSFSSTSSVAWYRYRASIKSVTVTATVHAGESLKYMFYGCESLESVDLSGLDTSSATDMTYMFYGCESLTFLDLSSLDTSSVTDMSRMFYGCSSLASVDLSGLDTSNVTSMHSMFMGCSSLTSVYLSGLDTSAVTAMYCMFYGCSSLTSVDLSGLDTSSATSMHSMFYGCSSLTSVDLSGLDTSSVTSMHSMFEGCTSLTSVDLSGLDTSSVTSTSSMFYECSKLVSLDLSGLDTSSVTLMHCMFEGCSSLVSLDLSGLDTSAVTNMNCMFYGCSSLTTVYVSELWSAKRVTEDGYTFSGCTLLVGGNGTAYSRYHIDSEYARIDTDDTLGYFTYKAYGASSDDDADDGSEDGDASGAVVTRLAGSTRYDTMAAIVEEAYEGQTCDYAVLATGANFADALSAASLAGALGAPVVLVRPGDPSAAIEVLQELGCSYAYVVGGTSAVSASDVAAIEEACGVWIQRVAGANRRETALAVAQATNAQASERSDTCIVATGGDFADALSASPYSYWAAAPIYLTRNDGTLDSATLEAIGEAGYSTVVVMGGTSAVTAVSEAALESLGVEVVRLSGSNRYDTCVEMAEWSVAQGMSFDGAAVATGAAFPDALAGAALRGRAGSVLLLASDTRTAAVELLAENAEGVEEVYLLGGESAVSASLAALVEAALG